MAHAGEILVSLLAVIERHLDFQQEGAGDEVVSLGKWARSNICRGLRSLTTIGRQVLIGGGAVV